MVREMGQGPEAQLQLPPGFRFYPTDEELVVHYLCKKAAAEPFAVPIIAEVDLYKFDPWDLPEKALSGEKEWYFFSPRDRKYPNGSRPNRAAGSGYWKATGTDKPISTRGGVQKVGVKKALVFYTGRAPKGVKTNWIMHEYRLADSGSRPAKRKGSQRLDDWVLCRIYNKISSAERAAREHNEKLCRNNDLVSASKLASPERSSSITGCTMEEDVKPKISNASLLELTPASASRPGAGAPDFSSSLMYNQGGLTEIRMKQATNLRVISAAEKTVARQEQERAQSSDGWSSCSDIPCDGSNEEYSTHHSPVDSSTMGEEDLEQDAYTSLLPFISMQPTTTGGLAQSDLFPFSFECLQSPYGRFESLSPSDNGWYFASLETDYMQKA